MDLVVIGHVTVDRMAGTSRPGGSAYYAALAAHRLGLEVGLLTAAGPDFPLAELPTGVAMVDVPSPYTTVFEHARGPAGGRALRLAARAVDLEVSQLPSTWCRAPLALLAPVANEVDPALAGSFLDASLCALPQGWMRARGRDGIVEPQPWSDADDVLPHLQMLVASDEDVAGAPEIVTEWAQRVPLAALTQAARGATLYVNGEPYHVAPDAAREVDETGAGDIFAAALLIEYQRHADPWEAAAAAACAGAAAVEAPGVGGLLDRAALDARVAAYRRRRGG